MLRLVLVGLLASVCAAEGRFSHEAKDEPLTSVVARLNKHFGFKLTLGDAIGDARVTLTFREATAPQALRALADAAKARLFRLAPGRYRIGESERERILTALDETMLQVVNFNTPLKPACNWLRSTTGITVFLDPHVKGTAMVRIKSRMSARAAFDTITEQAKVAWDVRYGVVFIATEERLAALPRDNPFGKLGIPTKRVSLPLNNSNIQSAASYLTAAGGIKITIDPAAPKLARKRITIHATNVRLVDALALVLVPNDCTLVKTDAGFVIKSAAR